MILAIKSADFTTQLCLLDPSGKPQHEISWDSGRRLSDQLPGKIQEFVRHHKLELSNLTGVVVFSGPGSFTSLRIGHTVANALADSLDIPAAGARGDDWLAKAAKALKTASPGRPVLPHYGAGAHITRPKS